ncbi:MAG TPA: hypothetical protein VNF73_15830 [Candidatus Saccharimonadales bacterium]|nr:hypothetical protein [Candidatus Saccharimonadales bacterium]
MTDAAARDGLEVEALLTDQYLDSLLAARDRRALDVPADPRLDPAIRVAARRLDTDLARVHPSFRFEERLAAELARRAAVARTRGGEWAAVPAAMLIAASAAPEGAPLDRRSSAAATPATPTAASASPAASAAGGAVPAAMPTAASATPASATPATTAAPIVTAASATPATTAAPIVTAATAAPATAAAPIVTAASAAAGPRLDRPRPWSRPRLQVRRDREPIGLPHLDRSMPRPLLIGGALTSAAISIAGAWVAWRRGRPPVAPMARAVRAVHRTGPARGLGLPLDRARRVGARRVASR